MKKKPNILDKFLRKFNIFKDKLEGLDFLEVIALNKLGLDKSLVSECSPSGGSKIKDLFMELNINNNDTIIDIGCGKGNAIRTMLDFPFQRIEGIEISKEIFNIASKNFYKLKSTNVIIHNINATLFRGYNNFKYFYLYNPFPSSVMDIVLKQIIKQSDRNKEIKIIYNNPICSSTILSHGFNFEREFQDQWGNGIKLYSKFT